MRESKEEPCVQIKEHIERNGGTITNAISELQLDMHATTFRRYAKKEAFDYKRYEHAFERYGHWLLLPCQSKGYSAADFKHSALCTKCSTIYEVSINNLRAGASTCCIKCSASQPRQKLSVVCEETGKTYKSLRGACKEYGALAQYKRIRLKLLKASVVEIANKRFRLI